MMRSIENFRTFIQSYIPLSDEEWEAICSDFKLRSFEKDDLIVEQGKICRHFYFFEEGLIRVFYNIDGNDITKSFAIPPYCFTSKISFRNQVPSEESIQALENTVVWRINYEQYRKLEKIETWNRFMHKLINEIQEFTEKRMLESKIYTAEQNYELLLKRYPAQLMQKIPLKHLASFLGVAPQSLSRIRNKLHTNRS
ncbi:Crp/Fnr family transcriptional regulator [uncultured Draconibacterium sp.]|uniref:Crp/Fnr family transcriptional regulator n=1 Tax=uncultured Draconibacterium sp. TaxID=1573823 RepID=UPI002AA89471|nr:Crp/Fnr family transcriptional regulator [uncultured Draconibacterium sp.]